MEAESQWAEGRDDPLSLLNAAISALELARGATGTTKTKDVVSCASALLTTIRDSMINEADCVELGLACADICQSVLKTMEQLAMIAAEIQRQIVEWGKQDVDSRRFHAKDDAKAIAGWRSDLEKIRPVFDKKPVISTDVETPDNRRNFSNAHTAVFGPQSDVSNAGVTTPEVPNNVLDTDTAIPLVGNDVHPCTIASGVQDGLAGAGTMTSSVQPNPGRPCQSVSTTPPLSVTNWRLIAAQTCASAPGESPPPLPAPDIRRDVVKAGATVSEDRRDAMEIQQTSGSREGDDDMEEEVSHTGVLQHEQIAGSQYDAFPNPVSFPEGNRLQLPSAVPSTSTSVTSVDRCICGCGLAACIPQREYDRQRTDPLTENDLQEMILFRVGGKCGYPLVDALKKQYTGLDGRDQKVFVGFKSSIAIRLEWLPYNKWTRQIRTLNWRKDTDNITLSKLATEVAKRMKIFFEEMESKEANPSYYKYRVQPGVIDMDHLELVALKRVAKASYMPHFRLITPPNRNDVP
ncbi:hypothetical protein BJ322DRAFT_1109090 [Thelephora terrestris]|uniref:Uncharacterized protein n=1 Tax=Thelephora terrestris TaxID=56493 RepID=A0A9P6HES1_9AGAM|nr:hypothetical protein BJ322DRAFT_1109090 [Thelephora terrestris]